jgi:hypothetical protein
MAVLAPETLTFALTRFLGLDAASRPPFRLRRSPTLLARAR